MDERILADLLIDSAGQRSVDGFADALFHHLHRAFDSLPIMLCYCPAGGAGRYGSAARDQDIDASLLSCLP